jgi:hypothetical protein
MPAVLEWSPRQKLVAVGGALGAMLVRADNGAVLRRRCALRFEVRTNVPARGAGTQNICN